MRFALVRIFLLGLFIPVVVPGLTACRSRKKSTRKRASKSIGNAKKRTNIATKKEKKVETTRQFFPLDSTLLSRLARTEIPGLQKEPGHPPQGGLLQATYHSTNPSVPLKVDVLVRGCDKDLCAPPELDAWKRKERQLPHYGAHMTKAFQDDPKKVMEASVLQFDGHKAIAFFWFGFSQRHVHGVTMTAATNDLFVYCNVGDKALIMVTVVGRLPKGAHPKDLAGFEQSAPSRKVINDVAVKAIEAFAKAL